MPSDATRDTAASNVKPEGGSLSFGEADVKPPVTGPAAVRTPVPWDMRWWLVGFVALLVPGISAACILSHRELMALPVMLLIGLTGGIYAGVCAGRVSVWMYLARGRNDG